MDIRGLERINYIVRCYGFVLVFPPPDAEMSLYSPPMLNQIIIKLKAHSQS